MQQIYQLKIAIRNSKPPIWRRVLVDESTSLEELHTIIQYSFDWENGHLHEFIVGNDRYAPKEFELEEAKDIARVTLKKLQLQPKDTFSYIYDFGDDWDHTITVEAITAADQTKTYPCCTAAKRMAPIEDCGGIRGFERLIAILQNPNHPEYEEMAEWCGVDEDFPFDPLEVDLEDINECLQDLGMRMAS